MALIDAQLETLSDIPLRIDRIMADDECDASGGFYMDHTATLVLLNANDIDTLKGFLKQVGRENLVFILSPSYRALFDDVLMLLQRSSVFDAKKVAIVVLLLYSHQMCFAISNEDYRNLLGVFNIALNAKEFGYMMSAINKILGLDKSRLSLYATEQFARDRDRRITITGPVFTISDRPIKGGVIPDFKIENAGRYIFARDDKHIEDKYLEIFVHSTGIIEAGSVDTLKFDLTVFIKMICDSIRRFVSHVVMNPSVTNVGQIVKSDFGVIISNESKFLKELKMELGSLRVSLDNVHIGKNNSLYLLWCDFDMCLFVVKYTDFVSVRDYDIEIRFMLSDDAVNVYMVTYPKNVLPTESGTYTEYIVWMTDPPTVTVESVSYCFS